MWKIAWRKWRCFALHRVVRKYQDTLGSTKLFVRIVKIHKMFGYPEDMNFLVHLTAQCTSQAFAGQVAKKIIEFYENEFSEVDIAHMQWCGLAYKRC